MKRPRILRSLITMMLLITSIAFAQKFSSEDIYVTTSNPDYIVKQVRILRIASDNSPKILCQKLHWFLKPYWAPREWDITLKVDKTGEGKFETKVNPNPLHNNTCGSSLISELRVVIYDSIEDKQFSFGSYLYTNGDETILLRAEVSYGQEEWEAEPSHKVKLEEIDRYRDDNNNYIDIEVVEKMES